MSPPPALRAAALALLLCLFARDGEAQEPNAVPPDGPSLAPPALETPLVVPYPPEALPSRIEGTVGLRVQVEADGHVSSAEVVESLGAPFDEAARTALLEAVFRPATRDGVAIVARILFRHAFAPPPPEVPAPEAAPSTAAPVSEPVAPPVPAPVGQPSADAPVEVHVRLKPSDAERLQTSADSVTVVELERARTRSSDAGEVMARTAGVSLRRAGGLGSTTRFTLNGLYNDQIRYFVEGVPLDVAGYPFELANVPLPLFDRIDVYRGVVPLRLSADALGGAVDLTPRPLRDAGGSASYQVGSFGTHRATLSAGYRHAPSGFVAAAEGFLDRARNDYWVDVKETGDDGRLFDARVRRFHDRYRADGGALTLGVVDRPWARRLTLRGYTTGYHKELQSNPTMTVPYGEVWYGERVSGTTLHYEQPLTKELALAVAAAYAHRTIRFVDDGAWRYNWFGDRVAELSRPGEIDRDATDQRHVQHTAFARLLATYALAPGHALRLAGTPSYVTRKGDERIQVDAAGRDPLTAERVLFTAVTGMEYELALFPNADAPPDPTKRTVERDYRFQNVLSLKGYFYRAQSEEPLPGGSFRTRDQREHFVGAADAVRVSVTEWLLAKASYEYAARLPRPDEVFGNGVLVQANLTLSPETSHNANLGPQVTVRSARLGLFTAEASGFLRDSRDLIVLLGMSDRFSYQNIARARTLGVDGRVNWRSPGRLVELTGTVTYFDRTNRSTRGAYASFRGDRMPNQPWLNASASALLHVERVLFARDELEPFYDFRYVHAFYRTWPSVGMAKDKDVIAAQLSHALGCAYLLHVDARTFSASFEVQNLTDARLSDFFGVQRPGRAFYAKFTADL